MHPEHGLRYVRMCAMNTVANVVRGYDDFVGIQTEVFKTYDMVAELMKASNYENDTELEFYHNSNKNVTRFYGIFGAKHFDAKHITKSLIRSAVRVLEARVDLGLITHCAILAAVTDMCNMLDPVPAPRLPVN